MRTYRSTFKKLKIGKKNTFSNLIVDFCIIKDSAFILNRNVLCFYDLTTYPDKNITKPKTKLIEMVKLIKTSDKTSDKKK